MIPYLILHLVHNKKNVHTPLHTLRTTNWFRQKLLKKKIQRGRDAAVKLELGVEIVGWPI